MKCSDCKKHAANANFCPTCGTSLSINSNLTSFQNTQKNNNKDDNLIYPGNKINLLSLFVISILVPGLGQIVIGQVLLGLIYFILVLTLGIPSFGAFYLVGGIISGFAACTDAKKLNSGIPIRKFYIFGHG